MGVETPYVLEHLYIISHQFAPAFVDQFADSRVAQGLSSRFLIWLRSWRDWLAVSLEYEVGRTNE